MDKLVVDKETKKRIKRATVATVASASIITAAAFETPDDLLKEKNEIKNEEVITIENKEPIKEEKSHKILETIPVLLRALFGIPLWLIGNILIKVINGIFKFVISPIVMFLLKWLIFALFILIIICIVYKLLFPDMSLKVLLNKKVLLTILVTAFLYALIDKILELKWDHYMDNQSLIRYLYGLTILTILTIPIVKERIKLDNQPKIIYDKI